MALIHHATAKKAEQLGFQLETHDLDAGTVQLKWGEHTFYHVDPKQLVEDARLFKMLSIEYPKLNVYQDGYDWVVESRGEQVGSGETLQSAWDEAAGRLAPDAEEGDEDGDDFEAGVEASADEDDEPAEEEQSGRSIVKRRYKKRYRPFKMTCGDELAQEISAHVSTKDEETGEVRIDTDKLRRFAIANDCWKDGYASLNPGQQRMNVGNRLRAKVKKGHEIAWA